MRQIGGGRTGTGAGAGAETAAWTGATEARVAATRHVAQPGEFPQ